MTTERDIHNQIVFARDKGRSEGLTEGRAEGAREQAILTARNFLNLGFPVEIIAQGTGLTAEEVEALR